MPSHLPLGPQLAGPVSTQRLSDVFAARGLQTPTLPGWLQDTQAVLQALVQQTPCVQWPAAHSPSVAQVAPNGFRPHDPLVQTLPAEQSASAVQVALQAAAPHLKGTHDNDVGVTQLPAPSQVARGVKSVLFAGQEGSWHDFPAGYFWQAPPSHLPLVPQLAPPWSTQVLVVSG